MTPPTDAPRPEAREEVCAHCGWVEQYHVRGVGGEAFCPDPTGKQYAPKLAARSAVPPSGEAEARGDGERCDGWRAAAALSADLTTFHRRLERALGIEDYESEDAPNVWAILASRLSSSAPGDGGEGADAALDQMEAAYSPTIFAPLEPVERDYVTNALRSCFVRHASERLHAEWARHLIATLRAALATPSTPSAEPEQTP